MGKARGSGQRGVVTWGRHGGVVKEVCDMGVQSWRRGLWGHSEMKTDLLWR